MSIRFY